MSAARHALPWCAHEDDLLRAQYGQRKAADLAVQLGRGVNGVRLRAAHLGLARTNAGRIRWPGPADATLRAHYQQLPIHELAARLGTTEHAVKKRASVLRLVRPVTRPQHWTAPENAQLRALYGLMPVEELAARLGRSRASVRSQVMRLGLRFDTAVANLVAENARLRDRPPPDAAHAPSDDARRLATLIAWRLGVISAAQAAVVLGVPVERLPVELGKAAKRGLDVVTQALGQEG